MQGRGAGYTHWEAGRRALACATAPWPLLHIQPTDRVLGPSPSPGRLLPALAESFCGGFFSTVEPPACSRALVGLH